MLLYAWSEIEFNTDQIITGLFGMNYLEERAELLTDWPFGKKLDYLKKLRIITKQEYRTVHSFQEKRNKIFHRDGLTILHIMPQAEKDELMNQAVEAAQICLTVAFRSAKNRLG